MPESLACHQWEHNQFWVMHSVNSGQPFPNQSCQSCYPHGRFWLQISSCQINQHQLASANKYLNKSNIVKLSLSCSFNWLQNSLSLTLIALYDLHMQTRPLKRTLALSILTLNACHQVGLQFIQIEWIIKLELFLLQMLKMTWGAGSVVRWYGGITVNALTLRQIHYPITYAKHPANNSLRKGKK